MTPIGAAIAFPEKPRAGPRTPSFFRSRKKIKLQAPTYENLIESLSVFIDCSTCNVLVYDNDVKDDIDIDEEEQIPEAAKITLTKRDACGPAPIQPPSVAQCTGFV